MKRIVITVALLAFPISHLWAQTNLASVLPATTIVQTPTSGMLVATPPSPPAPVQTTRPLVQQPTDAPSGTPTTKDKLDLISTLVTLYYSAALLVGLAVAFLGWKSVKDLREKATEIAGDVFGQKVREIKQIEDSLTSGLEEARNVSEQLAATIRDAKRFLEAKAAVVASESAGVDLIQLGARAKLLPPKERIEMLSALVLKAPQGPPGAFHNLGLAAEFAEDARLALTIWELGIQQHPTDVTLLTDAADVAAKLGDFPKAEALFKTAMETAPFSPRVWEFYIDYWFKYHDDALKAREVVEAQIDKLPVTPGLMREVGSVYEELGDLAKAEEFYRKGLAVEGDDHLLLNRLGLLLRRKGEIAEAAELIRLASIYSDGHANEPRYLTELGATLFAMKDVKGALRAFLAAEAQEKKIASLWIERCHIELAQFREQDKDEHDTQEKPDA